MSFQRSSSTSLRLLIHSKEGSHTGDSILQMSMGSQ